MGFHGGRREWIKTPVSTKLALVVVGKKRQEVKCVGRELEKEAGHWCRELRWFDGSLVGKSGNRSIAIHIFSPSVALDNDASDQWKFQDMKGNTTSSQSLISLREQEEKS